MHVKSIAEWNILQYFRPSLSYHLSLRPFLSIFELPLKTGFIVLIVCTKASFKTLPTGSFCVFLVFLWGRLLFFLLFIQVIFFFCFMLSADFFSISTFQTISFRNTFRALSNFDPDQTKHFASLTHTNHVILYTDGQKTRYMQNFR